MTPAAPAFLTCMSPMCTSLPGVSKALPTLMACSMLLITFRDCVVSNMSILNA